MTLPPPQPSTVPAWKLIAHQWQREQLLKARGKREAQQRFLCLHISGRREKASFSARTQLKVSVPFMVPTPKCARFTESIISTVECYFMDASVPPPLSSPPHPTSSATYPRSWVELTRQMRNHMPTTQQQKSRKWQWSEGEEEGQPERANTRVVQRERQVDPEPEGTTEGEQPSYVTKGGDPLICPEGFRDNVLPNYLNVKVQHQGCLVPAHFIQVKMYDKPIVLGTMGWGFPIFCQYAHAVQTLILFKATPYTCQEVLILHNKYPGRARVNQVLIDKGDEGLQAEVHHYQSLMDKADRKEHKLSTLQDHLMDISLNSHANMQHLTEAEAIKWLKDRRA